MGWHSGKDLREAVEVFDGNELTWSRGSRRRNRLVGSIPRLEHYRY